MTTLRFGSEPSVLAKADILVMPAFAGAHGFEVADAELAGKAAHGGQFARHVLRLDPSFQGKVGQLSALLVPASNEPARCSNRHPGNIGSVATTAALTCSALCCAEAASR